MGQIIWASSIAAVAAFFYGIAAGDPDANSAPVEPTVVAESRAAGEERSGNGSWGSALASAAWGMSALRPETYNGEIVIDLLEASPLSESERAAFEADLAAAELGRANLDEVLADIRVALALD